MGLSRANVYLLMQNGCRDSALNIQALEKRIERSLFSWIGSQWLVAWLGLARSSHGKLSILFKTSKRHNTILERQVCDLILSS